LTIPEQGKEPGMQARGPLMMEHRLIERMIAVVEALI